MHYSKIQLSLVFFLFLLPFVGAAQQWRVVEKRVSLRVAGGLYNTLDSIRYSYDATSNRGSNYTNDTINYISFSQNAGAIIGKKTYDNDDHILVDAVMRRVQSNVVQVQTEDSFTYQAGNLILQRRFQPQYVAGKYQLSLTDKYQYDYDAQNRVSLKKTNNYYSGVIAPDTFYNYYAYNTKGQLVKDSINKVSNGGAPTRYVWHYFAYNANDDTLYWEQHTIDTAGKAILFSRVDYSYNAQGQLLSDSLYYGPGNSLKHIKHSYTYDSQGRLTADTTKEYGYMASNYVTTYTYTPFNYYSEENIAMIDTNGNMQPYHRVNYEYELYWPVSINELANNNDNLTLYPNPATHVLHIKIETPFDKAYIYSNTGQLVKQVEDNTTQVDISQLPAGNYVLQLLANDEMISRQFVVVR
ncbi:MAG: T9SS type A sorting domain-containing protein [Flavipsychrobacter sp.]